MHEEIGIDDLRSWLDAGAKLVDVRERWEFVGGHLPGAVNVPMSEFIARMQEVPDNVVLVCHSGARSGNVAAYLVANGYSKVANLLPGTQGWRQAGLELSVGADEGSVGAAAEPTADPST